jgi:hypothetical protein
MQATCLATTPIRMPLHNAIIFKGAPKPCINLIMPKRQVHGANRSTYRHRATSKQIINRKYSLGFEAINMKGRKERTPRSKTCH